MARLCKCDRWVKGVAIAAAIAIGICQECRAEAAIASPAVGVIPALENPGSFSMIVVSDPQSYTKFAANQPLLDLQTAWIAENIRRLNIKTALITGDMVEQNNKLTWEGMPHPSNGNQTSRQQWEAMSRSLERLDGRLPYIACQGNHDVGYVASENRYSMQPEFIYPERNTAWERTLVSTAPDYRGINTMENAAFELNDDAWGPMLVIAFEFAPRDEALDWARTLIESDRFRNHRVIILTHAFLNSKGDIMETEHYALTPRNWPQAVWDKLIAGSKNIDLVVCGHAGRPPKFPDGATLPSEVDYDCNSSFRIEKTDDGRQVPIMMFNSQTGDGEWFGNGGDCWVRILEFEPDGQTVSVRTFSPLFAQSKLTRALAWRTAPYDQFRFTVPGKR